MNYKNCLLPKKPEKKQCTAPTDIYCLNSVKIINQFFRQRKKIKYMKNILQSNELYGKLIANGTENTSENLLIHFIKYAEFLKPIEQKIKDELADLINKLGDSITIFHIYLSLHQSDNISDFVVSIIDTILGTKFTIDFYSFLAFVKRTNLKSYTKMMVDIIPEHINCRQCNDKLFILTTDILLYNYYNIEKQCEFIQILYRICILYADKTDTIKFFLEKYKLEDFCETIDDTDLNVISDKFIASYAGTLSFLIYNFENEEWIDIYIEHAVKFIKKVDRIPIQEFAFLKLQLSLIDQDLNDFECLLESKEIEYPYIWQINILAKTLLKYCPPFTSPLSFYLIRYINNDNLDLQNYFVKAIDDFYKTHKNDKFNEDTLSLLVENVNDIKENNYLAHKLSCFKELCDMQELN